MGERVAASEAGVDFDYLKLAGGRRETLNVQGPVGARHAFDYRVRQFHHWRVLDSYSFRDFTSSDLHAKVRNCAQAAALAINENIDRMFGALYAFLNNRAVRFRHK